MEVQELAAVIGCARAGDEVALGELWKRSRRIVEDFIGAKWNMGDDVDDAAQQVFIRIPSALAIYELHGRQLLSP